ncbi:MAG: DNA polymerase III subunit delta [Candidatus Omnitrophica bacterium]|nr:DNA polymerase III subunit delta [Candidatus Omnitrophota bacterium]
MNKIVFLLIGHPFLVDEKFQTLVGEIQKKITNQISVQTFCLTEISLGEILTQARTLPFLAEAQVFRIREIETIPKDDLGKLETYLARPAPATYLVLEAESLEKKSALIELIRRYGHVFALDDRSVETASARLIQEKLKRFGKTMNPEVQERLLEGIGPVPTFLNSVLDQLIAYAGNQKQITESMVEAFKVKLNHIDGFELANAIGSQKTQESLRMLKELLRQNDEDVVALLGLLHWQLRRLWEARVLLDEGKREEVVLKRCSVPPQYGPFFIRQVKGFTRTRLEDVLERLFWIDWQLKTGRVDGPAALEAWVIRATAG